MTGKGAHIAGFQRSGSPPAGANVLPELSRVELLSAEQTRDGRLVPARSAGTIVEVLAKGDAYMVEFVEPFPALLTLDAYRVRAIRPGD